MTDPNMRYIQQIQPAERGSKTGWPTATGQIPPEVFDRLDYLARCRGVFRTDLVREAIERYLAHELNQAA